VYTTALSFFSLSGVFIHVSRGGVYDLAFIWDCHGVVDHTFFLNVRVTYFTTLLSITHGLAMDCCIISYVIGYGVLRLPVRVRVCIL